MTRLCPTSLLSVPVDSFDPFLHQSGWGSLVCDFLAGDASFRTYYRVTAPDKTAVLMDAPPPENPQQFCDVASLLTNTGFSAPHIYSFDKSQGLVLLEDLGDLTFTKALRLGHNQVDLYNLAIDTLIHLHKTIPSQPSFITDYSTAELLREAFLLMDWYWPSVKGTPPTEQDRADYEGLWRQIFDRCTAPKILVLRDFHVDNLMLLEDRTGLQRCGLLDFQDALWGSVVYDLVSLTEDARQDVSPELTAQLWTRYLQAFPHLNLKALQEEGCFISAGRHAKILGVFTRLAVRDHKKQYLTHMPRIWRWLDLCLTNPALSDLKKWFDTHFPDRVIPACL